MVLKLYEIMKAGIYVDGDRLKIAFLQKKRDSLKIEKSELPLNELNLKKLSKIKIISGLDAKDLLIEDLNIELSQKRALLKALPFQIESLNHLEKDQSINIPLLIKKNKKSSFFKVITTTKTAVFNHLKELSYQNIEPEYISTIPSALIRYALYKNPDQKTSFLIEVSRKKTTFVFMKNGQLEKSYSFPFGSVDFLESGEESGKIDLLSLKNKETLHSLEKWKNQLLIVFLSIEAGLKEKIPLFLTGDIGKLSFEPFFNKYLNKWISYIASEDEQFAISIGLCLDQLLNDSSTLQFRQKEFIPKNQLKKLSLAMLLLLILSIGGSLALFWVKNQTIQQLESTLSSQIDTAYFQEQQKIFNSQPSKKFLSQSAEKKLDLWNSQIEKQTKTLSYLFTGPTVKDCLSWIENHPFLKSHEKEIEIFFLNYKLTQFPKIESKNTPYKVAIKLKFKSKNPTVARQFHELLLKEDPFVNSKEKIDWNVLEDNYELSFLCKPL